MANYWEQETPLEVDTGKNILKYFQQARKLQISMPYWTDDDGNKRQGKTVTLNLSALSETQEAVHLLEKVIEDIMSWKDTKC